MDETIVGSERRQDERLKLRAYARLSSCDTQWDVHVLDVSRTGARIALLNEYLLELGDIIHLTFDTPSLGIASEPLCLKAEVAHLREHIIGLKYDLSNNENEQGLNALLDYGNAFAP